MDDKGVVVMTETETLCKSCKQPVEADAKTCPACGEEYPAVNTRKQLKVIAIAGVVLLASYALLSDWNYTPAALQPIFDETGPREAVYVDGAQIKYRRTLGLTPKQYAERLNAKLKALGMPYVVDPENIDRGEAVDFFEAEIGPFVFLIGTMSNFGDQLYDLDIYATGDGNRSSGEEIQAIAAAALASTSPAVEEAEIIRRLPDMVFKEQPFRHGSVEFKAAMSPLGISVFSVRPSSPE